MISRALLSVIFAGVIGGVLVTGAQQLRVAPLILHAETFEGEVVEHTHSESTPVGHAHEEEGWVPADGLERTLYTGMSNIVTGVAFALLLVAVYLLRGKPVDFNTGLLWGVAGFVVFAGAPALGLPPELPGMTAAVLEARQAWWIGTVIATALGIGLFVETKTLLPRLLGVVAIVLPHIIGAPDPHVRESNVPAELSAQFAVASLFTSAFFWMVLGAASGYFFQKLVSPDSQLEAASA
jgi:cobalt transporter subunit CbtA